MIDWKVFRKGWKQRRAIVLDLAGCPSWLIKWRCPMMKGWGTLLIALSEGLEVCGLEEK